MLRRVGVKIKFMPIFHLNSLPKSKRIQMIGEFYDVVDSLKDRSEVRLFFKDLLTVDEIATLMRRIEIAVLLSAKFRYNEISEILGVGNDKISRVHACLQRDESGYKIIIKRLIENRKSRLRKNKKEEKEISFVSILKKKYKGHFLLVNLLDTIIERLGEDKKELEKEALLFTPSSSFFRKRGK